MLKYRLVKGLDSHTAIAGAALLMLLSACAGTILRPDPPEFEIANVEVVNWNYPFAYLVISIDVNNPNNFDIRVDDVSLKLQVMNQSLADGKLSDVTVLPAHQKQNVRMPVAVNVATGMPLMMKLMAGVDVPYKLSGSVQLKDYRGVLPFEYDGRLSKPAWLATTPHV